MSYTQAMVVTMPEGAVGHDGRAERGIKLVVWTTSIADSEAGRVWVWSGVCQRVRIMTGPNLVNGACAAVTASAGETT